MSERNWNIALALSALACVAAWTWRVSQSPDVPDLSSEVYTVGETVPSVPGVRFSNGPQTLVLFVSSECPACSDTMPFYAELRAKTQRLLSPISFAVISFEDEDKLAAYLASYELEPDTAASVSYERFKLRRTPTLLLVDSSGVVKQYWIGRVSDRRKAEIFAAVGISDQGLPLGMR